MGYGREFLFILLRNLDLQWNTQDDKGQSWRAHPRFAKMVYIRQHLLQNLRNYKYAGIDHSLISRYVLKPFYSKCVINLFPMNMA